MVFAAVFTVGVSATAIAQRPPAVQLIDQPSVTDPTFNDKEYLTDNIRHVENIDYGYRNSGRSLSSGGTDLEFVTIGTRSYAVSGLLYENAKIIDITDPEAPVETSEIPCALYQNDVQITKLVDGKTLAILASDDNAGSCTITNEDNTTTVLEDPIGFAVADISDPLNPKVLSFSTITAGAHNVTVHPTEPIVYVSNANLGSALAVIHIWDISDPRTPVKVQDWTYGPGNAPHDITFNTTAFVQQSPLGDRTIEIGDRAYVASIDHTDIVDSSNPRIPVLITSFAHPQITISHQADPTPDGQYLLVTDELGGGSFAPVCPGGGVHIYKIGPTVANELTPVQVGAFFADQLSPEPNTFACTAHVLRINPDGKTLTIAWYGNGIHLMDFSNLLGPSIAGIGSALPVGAKTIASARKQGADTWSAKMTCSHPGYIFANDMGRGFDVFFVDGFAENQGCPAI